MDYKDWLAYRSNLAKRDVSKDERDYDLEGYFNSMNQTPEDPGYDPIKEAGKPYGGHLPDTFKLPNHPTFSDQSKYHVPIVKQGGAWSGNDDAGYKFKPSDLNMQNMRKEKLQSYFNQAEPNPDALDLPSNELQSNELMSQARAGALRKISGGR